MHIDIDMEVRIRIHFVSHKGKCCVGNEEQGKTWKALVHIVSGLCSGLF